MGPAVIHASGRTDGNDEASKPFFFFATVRTRLKLCINWTLQYMFKECVQQKNDGIEVGEVNCC